MGKIPISTHIFQMGWNHQPVIGHPLNSTQADEVIASFATEALLLQHWRLYKMRIEVLDHTPTQNGGGGGKKTQGETSSLMASGHWTIPDLYIGKWVV